MYLPTSSTEVDSTENVTDTLKVIEDMISAHTITVVPSASCSVVKLKLAVTSGVMIKKRNDACLI